MYGKVAGTLCLLIGLSGCALLREGNPVTDPGQGKGTAYPCGYWGVECADEAAILTPDQKCCPQNHLCKMDNDGPYCENQYVDPMGPVFGPAPYGAKKRTLRYRAR